MFQPRYSRTSVTYPDLSAHSFTEEEKKAFLALAEAEERAHGLSFRALCKRYEINRDTARHWKDRASIDLPMQTGPGRPSRLNEEDKEGTRSDLIQLRKDHQTPNRAELRRLFQAKADHTSEMNHTEKQRVSTSTLKRYKTELKIVPRKVQTISVARQHSGSDPRMVYSMVLLGLATMKSTPPQINNNWDFSQYVVATRGESETGFVLADDGIKDPISVVRDSALSFAIKYAHMGSAAGESAPVVFMVAISELSAGQWHVAEIPGLIVPTGSTRKGYLYFGKDRSGTPEFWRWFLKHIVLSTVVTCRLDYNLRDENGMPTEAVVTCDGEQIVMNEIFNNALRQEFTDHEVTLGKLPASCSGILQASDRAKTFLASKKRVKTIVEDDMDLTNPVLDANIKSAFKELEAKFTIDVPSGKQDSIVYGCKAVMQAITDTVKPHVIADGFRVTGQYPFNISLMLDQSYADIGLELRQTMNSRLEHDLALFREQGYLTEEQYEASGIPTNDDQTGMLRDAKGLHNQRAMLLNHPKTVQRRQLKLSNGVDLDDIMTAEDLSKEERIQLQAATKLIAADVKAQNKKRGEQERREGLTEEEKKADRLSKKQKTEINRQNKAANLQQAHELVENAKKGKTVM